MAKWDNNGRLRFWPIDMSKIGKVEYISVPQIDVNTTISELALERSYIHPNDPHWEMIDFDTEKVIDLVCQKIGRRTPRILDGIKGDTPNTDVLHAILSKCISDIHNYKNHYIDVEYDTIFGDANITLARYDMMPTMTIRVKCIQCLVIRDSDSMMVDLTKNGVDDLGVIEDLSSRCIDANMSYEIKIEAGDDTIEEKLNMQRPLWFIYGGEELVFLEDGPNQNLPQQQNINQPIYFDDVKVTEQGGNVVLTVHNLNISVGSVNWCKGRLAKLMFNRAKSKYSKSIMLMDVYDEIDTSGIPWDGTSASRAKAKTEYDRNIEEYFDNHSWEAEDREKTRANTVSKKFTGTISAAISSFNKDVSKAFGIANMKILQLKNKEVLINPEYLSPQLRNGRKKQK